jgi:hypothetical protein
MVDVECVQALLQALGIRSQSINRFHPFSALVRMCIANRPFDQGEHPIVDMQASELLGECLRQNLLTNILFRALCLKPEQ